MTYADPTPPPRRSVPFDIATRPALAATIARILQARAGSHRYRPALLQEAARLGGAL